MATYYSSWNSKKYSWGTAKTRCRLVITTSQSNTAVSISISGAVQCDGSYNISAYGVQVTVGNNSASGASAHSKSNTGVFDGGTSWKASASTSCSATRKTSAYSVSCYSKYAGKTVSGYGGCSNSGSVTKSVSVPARTSYKVTYNANGGTGAPGAQTKYYGTTLKLSSTKPTRTGHTFKGWATSASSSTVAYAAGANYTSNAALTLYAVWRANTYTITFNANGGTGGPTTVTKTYGKALTLPTAVPTRQNYNFKGWATTAEASTAQYQAGGSYTVEGTATLYAVWELAYIPPSITNFSADRCTSSGGLTDDGTYALVKFSWKTDNKAVQSIKIGYKLTTATSYTYVTVAASGASGSVSKVIGDNKLSTDYEYDISVVIADTMGSSTYTSHINSMSYIIDFLKGGKGVAIGKPATDAGFDVAMDSIFSNPATFDEKATFNTDAVSIFTDIGGATEENLGLKLLPIGTDLNELFTPGWYISEGVMSDYAETGGISTAVEGGDLKYLRNHSFCLQVLPTGYGQDNSINRTQIIYASNKTEFSLFQRTYYASAWGGWNSFVRSGARELWTGAHYMTANQTATLSSPITHQANGCVLVFSAYSDSTAQNYEYQTYFFPKQQVVEHPGAGNLIIMASSNTPGSFWFKYLYFNDKSIVGHASNTATGTSGSGVKYANNGCVLRAVYGV
mgnify:CR=1 FL=1